MQKRNLVLLVALGSTLCVTANARHTVADGWMFAATGTGLTADVTSPLAYNPINNTSGIDGSPVTLTGVTLSFSSGTNVPGYEVDTVIGDGRVAYYWDAPGGGFGREQVVITPDSFGATNLFSVGFGYDGDTTGETAAITVNGIEYEAANPAALDFTTIGSTSVNEAQLSFKGGVLQDAADYLGHGWTQVTSTGTGTGGTGGSVSAPEIDPASATSALTLLAGGLAIVLSGRRRKLAQLPA